MKKKVLSLLLVGAMLFGLVGCADKQESSDNKSSQVKENQEQSKEESKESIQESVQEDSKEEVTWTNDDTVEITIFTSSNNVPNDDNLVIQELEKKTNTKINMICVPDSEAGTKLNAMIGSGDLPDIFYAGPSKVLELKEAGLLADIEDVLNVVGPNILKETEGVLKKLQPNKGEGVYVIPATNLGYCTNMNIRTDWLENLGLDMPTDLKSFAEVMHAFTYDDPDQNGLDDTFGYSFNFENMTTWNNAFATIFGAFGIPKGFTVELEDGTVTTWVKHPNFVEAMEYIKALIDDGVCEPDFMTIPNMSMFEKFWNGDSGSMEWACAGPTNNWMPGRYTEDPVPTFDFAILEGPYGDSGSTAVYPSLDGAGFVFSADCENLEGAVRIANYLMSEEGSELLTFGVEGVMYEWVDKEEGVTQRLGKYSDDAVHRAEGGYCYVTLFPIKNNAELRSLNKQTQYGTNLAYDNMIDWPMIITPSKVQEEYGSDMSQVIKEMLAELLTTEEADLQSIYDSYIEEWENAGGKEWEEEVTELWKAQNE